MGLPETWWMKEGSELEINGKKFRVIKTETASTCKDNYCKPEKHFFFRDDYMMKVTDMETKFFKAKESDHLEEIKVESLKILKK